jgi:hypothetical protein
MTPVAEHAGWRPNLRSWFSRYGNVAIVTALICTSAGAWYLASNKAPALAESQREGRSGAQEVSGSTRFPNAYFERASFYDQRASADLAVGATTAPIVRRWSFAGTIEAWRRVGNVSVHRKRRGVAVATTPSQFAYQFLSQPMTLRSGSYTVRAYGRVLDGGLALGVIAVRSGAWISRPPGVQSEAQPQASLYWSGQKVSGGRMGASFTLARASQVQVIFTNWAPSPYSSSWQLSSGQVEKRD